MEVKSNQPLLSILMTAYNREAYITQAIDSVIKSTYGNWELIIVDDGSTDQTVKIAYEFAQKDNRIHVYENERNLGDYPNRNKAAGFARGEYLKYLDSDDLLYPHGLEIMIYYMEQFPEAGYGIWPPWNRDHPYPLLLKPSEAYEYNYFESSIFIRSPLSTIFRTTTFRECGGFPVQRMTSDFEMWHLLSQRYPVLLIPQGLTWYRMHGEQEVSERKKYTLNYLKISYEYIRHKQCPLPENRKKVLLRKLNHYKIKLIYRAVMKGNFPEIIKIIRI